MQDAQALLTRKKISETATSGKSRIKEDATSVINNFFKELSSGNDKNAITRMLSSNKNFILEDSAVSDLITKLIQINTHSGRFVDYKLMKEREVQGAVSLYSYLVRYEKKYYGFLFQFYNNGQSTQIYKFSFDDNLDIEIEESLKLYADVII